jgi:hypothetical protein
VPGGALDVLAREFNPGAAENQRFVGGMMKAAGMRHGEC